MMDTREEIKGTITLNRGEDKEDYQILRVLGRGGSTICYEAIRKAQGVVEKGILKEFYPVLGYGYKQFLKREDNMLVCREAYKKEFNKQRDYFQHTYTNLNEAILKEESTVIKNYVQIGDVLLGGDTLYIWTRGKEGIGLDAYIKDIKRDNSKPEKKLLEVLGAISGILHCIKSIHTLGYMHLDVKPSNFLVLYNSDYEIINEVVSLFDINTLTHIGDEPEYLGSYGFSPENEEEYYDLFPHQVDLYSIGAVLFHALVHHEEVVDDLYRSSYYKEIERLLVESPIISSSGINANPILIQRIVKVLKQSLTTNLDERYFSCEEMLEDVEKAKKKLEALMKTPLASRKEAADPQLLIYDLLDNHPLYQALNNEKEMKVLAVGSGVYTHQFIDATMQFMQIPKHSISIDVLCPDAKEERDAYLSLRPAMKDFITIDGKQARASYGTLCFLEAMLTNEPSNTLALLDDYHLDDYHYIFLDLGEYKHNEEVQEQLQQLGCKHVYCIDTTKKTSKADYINKELEDRAFNLHLSWNNSLNINISEERKRFIADTYNYLSSINSALSIKYKFYAMGINLSNTASKQVEEYLEKKEAMYQDLVYYEHRRWVLYTCMLGYTKGEGYEECVRIGAAKDSVHKTHACLVDSSPKTPLALYQVRDWDEAGDVSVLDELDCMSVQLHRAFRSKMQKLDKSFIYKIQHIKDVLYFEKDVKQNELSQYFYVIKQITDLNEHSQNYAKQYDFYYNNLLDALKEYQCYEECKTVLQEIHQNMISFIQYLMFRDYKKSDEDIINAIPFILTYQRVEDLVLGYNDEDVLENIISPTIINPENIHYICKDVTLEHIFRVVNYLNERVQPKHIYFYTNKCFKYQNAISVDKFTITDKMYVDVTHLEGKYPQTFKIKEDRIVETVNCKELEYIFHKPHLRLEDYQQLIHQDIKTYYPEYDHELAVLSDVYKHYEDKWQQFSLYLNKAKHYTLIQSKRKVRYEYIIPHYTYYEVMKIFKILEEHQYIENISTFVLASDSYKLCFASSSKNKKCLEHIINSPYNIIIDEDIKIEINSYTIPQELKDFILELQHHHILITNNKKFFFTSPRYYALFKNAQLFKLVEKYFECLDEHNYDDLAFTNKAIIKINGFKVELLEG